jgi:hypothetical protein
VPFCGLAVMEALSGIRTEVEDPLLEFIQQQQPRAVSRSSSARRSIGWRSGLGCYKPPQLPAVMAGSQCFLFCDFTAHPLTYRLIKHRQHAQQQHPLLRFERR